MRMEKSQIETETLSPDEQKLREMCLSLKKADAPADFDLKLKARIAGAKPSDFQPRFGFAFRYALPALAVILVLGFLAYSGGFLFSNNNPAAVAENSVIPQNLTPQNSAGSAPPEITGQPGSSVAVANPDSQKTSEKSQPQAAGIQNPKKDLRKEEKELSVRSKVFSLTEDKTNQTNFNSNSVLPNPQNLRQSNPISVKEVLSTNGIIVDLENGKWTVKAVTANGVGESSGVRENDIIEAIDNQPLSAETVFTKTVKGQTVTVLRKGEKTQIKLRNKQ
jgi:hypothetical protein